jgi:hypothetical protein
MCPGLVESRPTAALFRLPTTLAACPESRSRESNCTAHAGPSIEVDAGLRCEDGGQGVAVAAEVHEWAPFNGGNRILREHDRKM